MFHGSAYLNANTDMWKDSIEWAISEREEC